MTDSQRRLKVFTWHVHGTYLYYLSQVDCDFYLPLSQERGFGYGGRSGPFPFGPNVHEVPVDQIPEYDFDLILFQARPHYEHDQYAIFSPTQLALPKLYLEHDPPREHPTDTYHIVSNLNIPIIHCTDFNRLMWDSNGVPTLTIDHGVVDPGYRYQGTQDRGIVVINNLHSRGRRLGADLFEYIRKAIPLDLIGMNADQMRGLGEIPHNELPDFIAQYRFFFNPIRYTSMGLAIIEAMFTGLPIVGFQTTELTTVIQSGKNGYLSLNPDRLIQHMRRLLDEPDHAQQLGQNARQTALERFNIERFKAEWLQIFEQQSLKAVKQYET